MVIIALFARMQEVSLIKKIISWIWPLHLERAESAYNRVLDVDLYQGKLLLNTRRANYSFGRLHSIMEAVLKEVNNKGCDFNEILMLGYGGGSAASIIHNAYNPKAIITAIEIDEKVIHLARKWFYTSNVNIICADALSFVQNHNSNYDLIICDLFKDIYVPNAVLDKVFYRHCHGLLKNNGFIIQNLMPKGESNQYFNAFSAVFRNCSASQYFNENTIFTGNK